MMVGRAGEARASTRSPRQPGRRGDLASRTSGSSTTPARCTVDDVSFSVRGGEIYALAGVQGNGQTELTEALVGLTARSSRARSRSTAGTSPGPAIDDILDAGVGYVPEDRLHDGLVGSFTVAENLVLDLYDRKPFSNGAILDLTLIRQNAADRVAEFDVRTSSVEHPASHAVRRQPAEGRPRPRAVPAAEAADRRAADPGPRRRLDGVRAQAHRDRARRRRRRDPGVHRAGRGRWASPTGSVSCTAAKIIGEVARRAPTRDEIGLLMAGTVAETHEEAS